MRKLSDSFIKRLNGELKPLLDYILKDEELDLQIRDNYINVYYQGGNILKINPRSFGFDEFYFYTDCTKERKTDLQKKAKQGDIKAISIINNLKKSRDTLIDKLKFPLNYSKVTDYFHEAKEIMRIWEGTLQEQLKISHKEKQEQQQIAIANKKDTEYVVLDLEYAVSSVSPFSYKGDLDKKVPRFDIIAIHNGQLVIIELKKGMDATGGTSGIEPHIKCFKGTIGRDNDGLFIEEMKDLLKQKQELGLLENSLEITNNEPKFVFAFADKENENKFTEFASYCFKCGYKDELIYLNSSHKLNKAMSREYYYQQRNKQIKYYYNNLSVITQNKACFDGEKRDFVLQNGEVNLFSNIREDCLKYFVNNSIPWWGENKSRPSGHLVSSQIHCLNHLFALRKNPNAIKQILEKHTNLKIDKILPSPLDKDGSFITFEFVFENKSLLGEDYNTRGAYCTSVDALIYTLTNNKKVLVPIEWKYTETYFGKEATEKSLKRYPKLINSTSNLKKWIDLYKADPYYELMRQTLLMEQIINNKKTSGIEADDYCHIMVVPNAHTELRKAIEDKYIPTLKDKSKFHIIDPQSLLSPLEGNSKYKDLLNYLQTRYW